MKTKFFKRLALPLLLMAVVGLASCGEKEKDEKEIIGEWEWTKTYLMIPLSNSNPLTPKNTGITEAIIFTKDSSWSKIKNDVVVEFGEKFTLGHGAYQPYEQAYKREYDSILYIKNGIPIGTDYFKIDGNELSFSRDYTGEVGNGSKWFKKVK